MTCGPAGFDRTSDSICVRCVHRVVRARARTGDPVRAPRLTPVAGRIRREDVEAVRERVRIDEVVGAHVAHHELTVGLERAPGVLHGIRPAVTDASWRARLKNARPTGAVDATRASWVASFRLTR